MKDLTPENAFVSDVEKEVFGKLSSALGEAWTGAHNVKLLRGKAIFGEIDLLLMHPRVGVFVGEIKAGDYSRRRTYASRRQLRRVLPLLARLVEKHCEPSSGSVPDFFPFLCFPQTHSRVGKLSTPHMLAPDLENPEAFFQDIVLPENRAGAQISALSALSQNARAEIVFFRREISAGTGSLVRFCLLEKTFSPSGKVRRSSRALVEIRFRQA